MEQNNTITIAVWLEKSQSLLNKIEKLFKEIDVDTSDLPKSAYDSNNPISLVFAGQYSAGKSTILKALTGIKTIETGEQITTQVAHTYDWNGLRVIDTPGIHTTLRPDHDKISYEAISNADILVYVVTHELFDSYIGQNFRKLLLEKDKAGEMILIVNKMATVGNSIENRNIKLEGLRIVTTPYSPEQLRTCFIDAESYIDSLDEDDEEIVTELVERSNFAGLVNTINGFVREKSISSKLTTSLYKMESVLQRTITQFQPSSGDVDIDALEEHLLQERRILFSSQFKINHRVNAIYQETAISIRDKGRDLANRLYDFSCEDEANHEIEAAYHDVENMSNKCVEDVTATLEELSKDCMAELDEFYNTDFSKELQFRLSEKYKNGNPLVEKLFKSDVLTQGSNKIITNTMGENATATGLKAFSGSNMHQLVLDIGHFFGHSFKPWEAVKWVKGINVAGKVLGVFGVVFSLGIQIKEDVDADNRQQEMRTNREKLRAGFNDAASGLITQFENSLKDFINTNYVSKIESIDNQIDEIRKLRTGKTETCKLLEVAHTECNDLIHAIHVSDISE